MKKDSGRKGKLKDRQYEKELARLHVEVVKLQEWVKQKGAQGLHRVRRPRRRRQRAERSRPSPSA